VLSYVLNFFGRDHMYSITIQITRLMAVRYGGKSVQATLSNMPQ
jgi:hypothetical protein